MKKILLLPFAIFFMMCCSPKINYSKQSDISNNTFSDKFLNSIDAKDSIYSVLFFTDGFLSGEKIEVKNDKEIIFSDTLVTDRVLGHAKTIRFVNSSNLIITDLKSKYSFKLKAKKNRKYKYIYVSKDAESNYDYTVTYRNTFRGFY